MNREIRELTDIMTQMDLSDIYRTFHPNRKEYSFFSAPHGTFLKIDYVFGKKNKSKQIQKIGITPCILSDHHDLKLEVNSNTNSRMPTNTSKLNSAHLINGSRRNKGIS